MKKIYNTQEETLQNVFQDETLFTVQNRMLGLRGSFSEGIAKNHNSHKGFYINGFHSIYEYQYGEKGVGFPDNGEIIINLPDPQTIYAVIDGVILNSEHAEITSCERECDVQTGIITRKTCYRTKEGFEFEVIDKRVAPLDIQEVVIIEYSVISKNYTGKIELVSETNTTTKNIESNDPRVGNHSSQLYKVLDVNKRHIHITSKHTNIDAFIGIAHKQEVQRDVQDGNIIVSKKREVQPNQKISFTKYICVTSTLYHDDAHSKNRMILSKVFGSDISDYTEKFDSGIKIIGNKETDEYIQYNLFQLNRSGAATSDFSIAAKGLSGEGYEGHYFWDTEMYMFPYFLLTDPPFAKKLLEYRYEHLEDAKKEAIKLGHNRGAKIPWRTISGKEVSPYFLAGSAQYHINGIVGYSVIQYFYNTQDLDFLIKKGFELLYQTALIYLEIGHFNGTEFVIQNVTGPDEYTTLINNNYYTNSLAKYHMSKLLELYKQYKNQLDFEVPKEDLIDFKNASTYMKLVFNQDLGIYAQDDTFLQKQPLDLTKVKQPLLLHYHPNYIYRKQVSKQADTIASYFLLDDVDEEIVKKSLDYYEKITTHDSSLSKCIFSVMHSYVGNIETGEEYFDAQLRIDIDNTLGNTQDGLHVANLGGTYLVIVFGFLGLRIKEDSISIQPKLPRSMKGYEVSIHYNGEKVRFQVNEKSTKIETTGDIMVSVDGIHYVIHDVSIIKRA